jgi:quinol-cytochrome oxidoreductase complex cytochrome b subunit
MGMVELFVPIAAFMTMAVMVGLITRLIATGMLNRTIREAMRSDPGSVPLLAQRLEARQPWADSLLGWIFLAFALALLVLGLLEADPERRPDMLKSAVIPAIVGAAVLLYIRFARPSARP